jgi:hypothetical protein
MMRLSRIYYIYSIHIMRKRTIPIILYGIRAHKNNFLRGVIKLKKYIKVILFRLRVEVEHVSKYLKFNSHIIYL